MKWLDLFLRSVGALPPPAARPPLTVRRVTARPSMPAASRLPARRANGRARVERDRRPLWETRGWRREGRQLVGAYRTPVGAFLGQIVLKQYGAPDYYILNPPAALLASSHGPCFRRRAKGQYFVHFCKAHADVDAGIAAVEQLLAVALGMPSRRRKP